MPNSSIPNYLRGLLADVVHVPDPADRLRMIRDLRGGVAELDEALRAARRDAILELRDRPLTWGEIGELLGVSAQRAEKLSRTP